MVENLLSLQLSDIMLTFFLPFASSLAVMLLVRYFDRRNSSRSRMIHLIERSQKDINNLFLAKKEELADLVSEFNLIRLNTDKYLVSLNEQLDSAKQSFKNVVNAKEGLQSIEIELTNLESTVFSVQGQMTFIHDSLDKIDRSHTKLQGIEKKFEALEKQGNEIQVNFQKDINHKSDMLIDSSGRKIQDFLSQANQSYSNLQQGLSEKQSILEQELQARFSTLESHTQNNLHQLTSDLEHRIQVASSTLNGLDGKSNQLSDNLEIKLPSMLYQVKHEFEDYIAFKDQQVIDLQQSIDALQSKLDTVSGNIGSTMEAQEKLFLDRFSQMSHNIHAEIEELDLEALEKKDNLLKVVRDEAHNVRDQISNFESLFSVKTSDIEQHITSLCDNSINQFLEIYGKKCKETETLFIQQEENSKLMQQILDSTNEKVQEQGVELFDQMQQVCTSHTDQFYQIVSQSNNAYSEAIKRDRQGLEQLSEDTRSMLNQANLELEKFRVKILEEDQMKLKTILAKTEKDLMSKQDRITDVLEQIEQGAEKHEVYQMQLDNVVQEGCHTLSGYVKDIGLQVSTALVKVREQEKDSLDSLKEYNQDIISNVNQGVVVLDEHKITLKDHVSGLCDQLDGKLQQNEISMDEHASRLQLLFGEYSQSIEDKIQVHNDVVQKNRLSLDQHLDTLLIRLHEIFDMQQAKVEDQKETFQGYVDHGVQVLEDKAQNKYRVFKEQEEELYRHIQVVIDNTKEQFKSHVSDLDERHNQTEQYVTKYLQLFDNNIQKELTLFQKHEQEITHLADISMGKLNEKVDFLQSYQNSIDDQKRLILDSMEHKLQEYQVVLSSLMENYTKEGAGIEQKLQEVFKQLLSRLHQEIDNRTQFIDSQKQLLQEHTDSLQLDLQNQFSDSEKILSSSSNQLAELASHWLNELDTKCQTQEGHLQEYNLLLGNQKDTILQLLAEKMQEVKSMLESIYTTSMGQYSQQEQQFEEKLDGALLLLQSHTNEQVSILQSQKKDLVGYVDSLWSDVEKRFHDNDTALSSRTENLYSVVTNWFDDLQKKLQVHDGKIHNHEIALEEQKKQIIQSLDEHLHTSASSLSALSESSLEVYSGREEEFKKYMSDALSSMHLELDKNVQLLATQKSILSEHTDSLWLDVEKRFHDSDTALSLRTENLDSVVTNWFDDLQKKLQVHDGKIHNHEIALEEQKKQIIQSLDEHLHTSISSISALSESSLEVYVGREEEFKKYMSDALSSMHLELDKNVQLLATQKSILSKHTDSLWSDVEKRFRDSDTALSSRTEELHSIVTNWFDDLQKKLQVHDGKIHNHEIALEEQKKQIIQSLDEHLHTSISSISALSESSLEVYSGREEEFKKYMSDALSSMHLELDKNVQLLATQKSILSEHTDSLWLDIEKRFHDSDTALSSRTKNLDSVVTNWFDDLQKKLQVHDEKIHNHEIALEEQKKQIIQSLDEHLHTSASSISALSESSLEVYSGREEEFKKYMSDALSSMHLELDKNVQLLATQKSILSEHTDSLWSDIEKRFHDSDTALSSRTEELHSVVSNWFDDLQKKLQVHDEKIHNHEIALEEQKKQIIQSLDEHLGTSVSSISALSESSLEVYVGREEEFKKYMSDALSSMHLELDKNVQLLETQKSILSEHTNSLWLDVEKRFHDSDTALSSRTEELDSVVTNWFDDLQKKLQVHDGKIHNHEIALEEQKKQIIQSLDEHLGTSVSSISALSESSLEVYVGREEEFKKYMSDALSSMHLELDKNVQLLETQKSILSEHTDSLWLDVEKRFRDSDTTLSSRTEELDSVVTNWFDDLQKKLQVHDEKIHNHEIALEEQKKQIIQSLDEHLGTSVSSISALSESSLEVYVGREEEFKKYMSDALSSMHLELDKNVQLLETQKSILSEHTNSLWLDVEKRFHDSDTALSSRTEELDSVVTNWFNDLQKKLQVHDGKIHNHEIALEEQKKQIIQSLDEHLGTSVSSISALSESSLEVYVGREEEFKKYMSDALSSMHLELDKNVQLLETQKSILSEHTDLLWLDVEKRFRDSDTVLSSRTEELDSVVTNWFDDLQKKLQVHDEKIYEYTTNMDKHKNVLLMEMQEVMSTSVSSIETQSTKIKYLVEGYTSDLETKVNDSQSKLQTHEVDFDRHVTTMLNQADEKIHTHNRSLMSKYNEMEDYLDTQMKLLSQRSEEEEHLMKQHESEIKHIAVTSLGEIEDKIQQGRHIFDHDKRKLEDYVNSTMANVEDKIYSFKHLITESKGEIIEDSQKSMKESLMDALNKVEENKLDMISVIEHQTAKITNLRRDIDTKHSNFIEDFKQHRATFEQTIQVLKEKELDSFSQTKQAILKSTQADLQDAVRSKTQLFQSDLDEIIIQFSDLKNKSTNELNKLKVSQEDLYKTIHLEGHQANHEMQSFRDSLQQLKEEIHILELSKQRIQETQLVISHLTQTLDTVEQKNVEVQNVANRIDTLSELTSQVESNISSVERKEERIKQVEVKLNTILTMQSEIVDNNQAMQQIHHMINQIVSDYTLIEEHKGKIDGLIEEMVNQQKLVEISTKQMEEKSVGMASITEKMDGLAYEYKRMESKQQNMKTYMESLSDQILSIEKNEAEIELVKQKFLEIEDLIEDVDRRKQQIDTLRHKFEDLKSSMHADIAHIQKIETNAEQKVKKLAEFVGVLDDYIPDVSITKDVQQIKNMSNHKEVVTKLDKMGWTSEEIAKNMNMELGLVKTIIATLDR